MIRLNKCLTGNSSKIIYKVETDLSDFSRIHCTPWHDPQEHAFESRFSLKLASVTTRNATMPALGIVM